jgi:hypothetical protein
MGLSYPLWFGLDLTATDGIDPTLGESDLPPPPPGNAFDARFWLPPFAGALSSWRDYRAPGNPPAFPFTGQIHHVIKFQSTDFPITISWNLPSTIASTSIIKDPFNLQQKSFSGADSIIITLSAIPYVETFVDYVDIVPVELTSFTANVIADGILLEWVTATELNNSGFEVERKLNTWEKIGFVPGFGTTTEPKTYSFMDENVTTGTYTYRLKQIDFDGTSAYSDEVVVEVDFTPNSFALLQNYPNPFNPNTTIQFQVPKSSDVDIKIYDMLGQQIKSLFTGQVEAGNYSVNWDGTNDSGIKMSSGSYIYRMTAGDFVDTKEMIFLK